MKNYAPGITNSEKYKRDFYYDVYTILNRI